MERESSNSTLSQQVLRGQNGPLHRAGESQRRRSLGAGVVGEGFLGDKDGWNLDGLGGKGRH